MSKWNLRSAKGLMSLKKIAILDMDNTLLRASFIQTAAEKFGFKKELVEIATTQTNPFIRTKLIAKLLKGRSIRGSAGSGGRYCRYTRCAQVVKELKAQGFIVGIISDSYDCITNHFKNRFEFDFSLANELEFSNSMAPEK